MLKSDYCTLGWDATTLDGVHLNGIYISTDTKQKFLISIGHLARPDTKHKEQIQLIYNRIYSTMMDQLPTNKAVIRELQKDIGLLYSLYCNVHPLDTMASTVKKLLREGDGAPKSKCFGNESACGNTLQAIAKLRHKAKG